MAANHVISRLQIDMQEPDDTCCFNSVAVLSEITEIDLV